MDGEESILEALEEDESLAGDLSDVDMIDAESPEADVVDGVRSEVNKNAVQADGGEEKSDNASGRRCGGGVGSTNKAKKKKKRNSRLRRVKAGNSDYSFTYLNSFVFNTCRHLKEKKQYLVWSAVRCLGISAVRDLVKEVDAIQACGGQQTVDGTRPRTSGGVLWNILKTREPAAYKEIMAKGREFENQFRPIKMQKVMKEKHEVQEAMEKENKVNSQRGYGSTDESRQPSITQRDDGEMLQSKVQRPSALDRIRTPVSYDDLFEEGEIHDLFEQI